MNEETFENFKNEFFTVKRTEKFNSGTWTDMVIEQSLMKSMKTKGEYLEVEVLNKVFCVNWCILCMLQIQFLRKLKFCDILISSAEQHVDARDSRVKRDNIDVTS